jgi:acetylornithine deacetylase/succinyl-diaminopimelate desuccinylase-like protein
LANQTVVNYLDVHKDEHVAKIQELVRQPSVSTEGLGIAAYASLLRDHYAGIGCSEAQVVDSGDDLPGVWAYYDAGAPNTIACYSYFDTYGVDEARWDHPPFAATRLPYDGFPEVIMGRGATVKGSHRAWLNALEALAAVEGTLPVNVLFLSEGAEMLGSPNFEEICTAAGARLDEVDAFLSPRMAERQGGPEVPVVLGYKNMVTFDLVCNARSWGRGPTGGTVYGNSKSVVDAPTHRLVQALASLLEPDGNGIAIDGLAHLNHERVELSPGEERLFAALLERFADAPWNTVLPTTAGVERWVGDREAADLLYAYLYGPSINVSEIRSAGVGDAPRLTMLLPDSARASVELRLVTDIEAEEVLECVRRHLVARGFSEIEILPFGLWDGQRVPDDTVIVEGVLSTLEAYGRVPVIWPIQPFGGPWAGAASRRGMPSLTGCALGYGANGGGAANEYFAIESESNVAGLVAGETYLVDLLSNVADRLAAHTAAGTHG